MPEFSEQEAELSAVEFFAPLYMLMNLYDAAEDKEQIRSLAEKHIYRFLGRIQRSNYNRN